MRNSGAWWIIVGVMILLDLYVFQVLRFLTSEAQDRTRTIIHAVYWLVSVSALAFMVLIPFVNYDTWPKQIRTYFFAIMVGLFFAKLVAVLFFAADDARRGAMWVVGKLFSNPSVDISNKPEGISRSVFLSWVGMGLGGTLFSSLIFGFRNKYRYRIERIKLSFPNLPSAFKGLRIMHISDIHVGSLMDKHAVQKGVEKIMNEKADIILFTGDLVNDHAREMDHLLPVFRTLEAPLGVYSVLGNHDYGEYALPPGIRSEERKKQVADNVAAMRKLHLDLGWKLLMNEHVVLEKESEKIAVIGVENWGAKGRFPKYGKLAQAWDGTQEIPFKILLSHDPSHWDAEIRKDFPDIDLTLSGHTHGMQFGVEIPGLQWSPVQYMYKQWGGLYESGNQKLYVNRGFGFIGYPGRVGILPEITVIELI